MTSTSAFFCSPAFLRHSCPIHRVIPFLVIALVLEELIPLIAIYAPFMLPSTCILPSQQQRIEAKRAEKAKAYATQYKYLYGQLKRSENPKGFLPLQSLQMEGASTAICGCVSFVLMGRGLESILSFQVARAFNDWHRCTTDTAYPSSPGTHHKR